MERGRDSEGCRCSTKPNQGQGMKGGGWLPTGTPYDHCHEPALGFFKDPDHSRPDDFCLPSSFPSQIKNRPSPEVAPSFLPGWGHLSQLRAQERRAYPRAEAAAKPQRCGSERPIHGAD